jgi:hypothetical protein
MAEWVYGVVAGECSPGVEIVRYEELGALVSVVTEELDLEDVDTVARLARAHDSVLRAAHAQTDVIPFRLGALYASRDAVADMLRERADAFRELLARLRGMTEWGVKGFPQAAPAAPPPKTGAEYLARRRAERETATVETAAAEVHEALAARAAAAELNTPRDQGQILNGAYLVPRDAAFAALVDEQGRRHAQLELKVTGPWPPYSFVA